MQTESTIEDWLDALASDAPTPGGGAAAALSGAMAAALVAMICRFTIGRPRYARFQIELKEIFVKSEILRQQLEESIEADVVAYGNVIAARKLDRSTPESVLLRSHVLQASLFDAASVPLETARLASEVVEIAGIIAEKGNRNLLSDASVAITLAVSSAVAAAANVRANLPFLSDETQKQELAGAVSAILERVERARISAMIHLEQLAI